MGLGPLVDGATLQERTLGTGGLLLGTILLVCAVALASRRGSTRRYGVIGGYAMAAIGVTVTLLAITSYGACTTQETTLPCYTLIAGINMVGVGVFLIGILSVVVIRRAPASAFRRTRRRAPPEQR